MKWLILSDFIGSSKVFVGYLLAMSLLTVLFSDVFGLTLLVLCIIKTVHYNFFIDELYGTKILALILNIRRKDQVLERYVFFGAILILGSLMLFGIRLISIPILNISSIYRIENFTSYYLIFVFVCTLFFVVSCYSFFERDYLNAKKQLAPLLCGAAFIVLLGNKLIDKYFSSEPINFLFKHSVLVYVPLIIITYFIGMFLTINTYSKRDL